MPGRNDLLGAGDVTDDLHPPRDSRAAAHGVILSGTWVQAQGNTLPLGAILAGSDDDGSPLYMIRSKKNGADAFAPVEVTPKAGAIYTMDVTSETFDPTMVIVDKKTQKTLDLLLDQQGRQVSTATYVEAGQTLIIQVRPASPLASPKPAGAFMVNVRLDGFGS